MERMRWLLAAKRALRRSLCTLSSTSLRAGLILSLVLNLVLPVIGGAPAVAQVTGGAATLTVLQQPVNVTRADGVALAGVTGLTLFAGDVVETGAGGGALLTMFDGSTTELSPVTQVALTHLEQSGTGQTNVSLFQAIGQTISRIGQLLVPGSTVQTQTPSSVALVRGTIKKVKVGANGATELDSFEGTTELRSGGQRAGVGPNQRSAAQDASRGPDAPAEQPSPPPASPTIAPQVAAANLAAAQAASGQNVSSGPPLRAGIAPTSFASVGSVIQPPLSLDEVNSGARVNPGEVSTVPAPPLPEAVLCNPANPPTPGAMLPPPAGLGDCPSGFGGDGGGQASAGSALAALAGGLALASGDPNATDAAARAVSAASDLRDAVAAGDPIAVVAAQQAVSAAVGDALAAVTAASDPRVLGAAPAAQAALDQFATGEQPNFAAHSAAAAAAVLVGAMPGSEGVARSAAAALLAASSLDQRASGASVGVLDAARTVGDGAAQGATLAGARVAAEGAGRTALAEALEAGADGAAAARAAADAALAMAKAVGDAAGLATSLSLGAGTQAAATTASEGAIAAGQDPAQAAVSAAVQTSQAVLDATLAGGVGRQELLAHQDALVLAAQAAGEAAARAAAQGAPSPEVAAQQAAQAAGIAANSLAQASGLSPSAALGLAAQVVGRAAGAAAATTAADPAQAATVGAQLAAQVVPGVAMALAQQVGQVLDARIAAEATGLAAAQGAAIGIARSDPSGLAASASATVEQAARVAGAAAQAGAGQLGLSAADAARIGARAASGAAGAAAPGTAGGDSNRAAALAASAAGQAASQLAQAGGLSARESANVAAEASGGASGVAAAASGATPRDAARTAAREAANASATTATALGLTPLEAARAGAMAAAEGASGAIRQAGGAGAGGSLIAAQQAASASTQVGVQRGLGAADVGRIGAVAAARGASASATVDMQAPDKGVKAAAESAARFAGDALLVAGGHTQEAAQVASSAAASAAAGAANRAPMAAADAARVAAQAGAAASLQAGVYAGLNTSSALRLAVDAAAQSASQSVVSSTQAALAPAAQVAAQAAAQGISQMNAAVGLTGESAQTLVAAAAGQAAGQTASMTNAGAGVAAQAAVQAAQSMGVSTAMVAQASQLAQVGAAAASLIDPLLLAPPPPPVIQAPVLSPVLVPLLVPTPVPSLAPTPIAVEAGPTPVGAPIEVTPMPATPTLAFLATPQLAELLLPAFVLPTLALPTLEPVSGGTPAPTPLPTPGLIDFAIFFTPQPTVGSFATFEPMPTFAPPPVFGPTPTTFLRPITEPTPETIYVAPPTPTFAPPPTPWPSPTYAPPPTAIPTTAPAPTAAPPSGGGGGSAPPPPPAATPMPPNITSIFVSPSNSSATITWGTNRPSTSVVFYGTDGSFNLLASGPSGVTSHSVTLSGLAQGTTYNYKVQSSDEWGTTTNGPFTFMTTDNRPDLAVSAFSASAGPDDHAVPLSVAVHNQGGSSTVVGFQVKIFADPASPPNTSTTGAVATIDFPALLSGTSDVRKVTVAAGTLTPGSHTLWALADSGSAVTESNEGNNTASAWANVVARILRASQDSSGAQGDAGALGAPSISASGRYMAFASNASNLVAADTNGATDIFVRDTVANATTRVSVDSSGLEANGNSYEPSISADGRYVAFYSYASNLVAGDTSGFADVFVRDIVANTTSRVSVDSSGGGGSDSSSTPSISANGRYVAFHSNASNLVADDTNGATDIFVRDTVATTTTRVSVGPAAAQANSTSYYPSISADGRYVAFYSISSNLVAGDTNGVVDIFVRDTVANTTARVSVDSSGVEGNNYSYRPSISADGRYVAFDSLSSNLVAGDTNGATDIFVRDTVANTTTRVSVDSSGLEGNNHSYGPPSISADGRYVAFHSRATNLVAGDTNGAEDVFVRDTVANTTSRQSVDASGAQTAGASSPSLSFDGRFVAFTAYDTTLVSGDTNAATDVFRRFVGGPLDVKFVAISGHVLTGTAAVAGVVPSARCLSPDGSNCLVLPSSPSGPDGSFTVFGHRGLYDLFARPAHGGYESTGSLLVDARGGPANSTLVITGQDLQVVAPSATVSGAVRDEGASPLAGALVQVRVASLADPASANVIAGTVTASDGSYSLQVAPGSYSLRASASMYQAEVTTVTLPGAGQDFSLASYPVEITGQVLSGTTPIANVRPSASCVTALGAACDFELAGPTDANGSFTLYGQEGRYDLFVANAGHLGLNSTVTTVVDAMAGGFFPGEDIQVSPATVGMSGTVIDETTGAPLSGARVSLRVPENNTYQGKEARVVTVVTDTSGRYRLQLAPGAYEPRVEKQGYGVFFGPSISLTDALMNENIPLRAHPVTITGRVLRGSTPLANVFPNASCRALAGSPCSFAFEGSTGADGIFTLHGEPGRYDLWASSSAGGAQVNSTSTTVIDATSVGTSPATYSGRDILISASTTLVSGTVTDDGGSPVSGASVSLRIPSQADPYGMVSVATTQADADGNYALPGAPATYAVVGNKFGFRPTTVSGVVVSGTDTFQDLTIEAYPVTITGQVLTDGTPAVNVQPSAACVAPGAKSCTFEFDGLTDGSGGFTLRGDLGRYDLYVQNSFSSRANSTSATFVDASAGGSFSNRNILASSATTNVSGTFTNASGGAPLDGATADLRIPWQGNPGASLLVSSTTSDAAGAYTLQVAPSTYRVVGDTVGYRTLVTQGVAVSGTNVARDFALERYPLTITGRVLNGTSAVAFVSPSWNCFTINAGGCIAEFAGRTGSDGSYTLYGDHGQYDLYVGNFGSGVNSTAATFVDGRGATTFSGQNVQVGSATVTVSGSVTNASAGTSVSDSTEHALIASRANLGTTLRVASFNDAAGSGTYSLNVAPGTYTVQGKAPGFRSTSISGVIASTSTTQDVELTQYPVTITGAVLNGGSPVANIYPSAACATLASGGCAFEFADRTAANGSYTLYGDQGVYDLYVSAAGGIDLNSLSTTLVHASAGSPGGSHNIVVASADTTLSGAVTDATLGSTISRASVSLGIPQQGYPGRTLPAASAVSDSSGNYSLRAAPGTYVAQGSAIGYATRTLSTSISGASASQNIALYHFPYTFAGRLLNGTTPLANVQPSAICNGGPCSYQFAGRTASDGSFTLYTNPGTFDLFVQSSTGYNSTAGLRVDTASGSFTGQDVQATSVSATVTGTVTDGSGTPISGARVNIRIPQSNGQKITITSATTDASGSYTVQVAPSTTAYSAQANAIGYHSSTVSSVVAPSSGVNFSLTPYPVTITGQVLIGGSPVPYVSPSAGSTSCAESGGSCSSSFAGRTASDGSYTLYADRARYDLYVASSNGVNSLSSLLVDVTAASPGATVTGQDIPVAIASESVSGALTDSSTGAGLGWGFVWLNIPQQGSTSGGMLQVATAVSDGGGAYSLQAASGTYTATTWRPYYDNQTRASVAAPSTQNFALVLSVPTVSSFGPSSINAGGSISISGTNFGSGTTISVDLVATQSVAAISAGLLSGTVSASSSGSFSGNFTLAGSQAPGTYYVRAASGATSAVSSGTLVVTAPVPSMSVSGWANMVPGGAYTVSGSNFDSAAASVTVDLVTTPSTSAASAGLMSGLSAISAGTFSGTYNVAFSQGTGTYYIRATAGASSAISSGTFVVSAPSLSFGPSSIWQGGSISVSGSNFAANNPVSVDLYGGPSGPSAGTFTGSATTNASGSFSDNFTVSSSQVVGTYYVHASAGATSAVSSGTLSVTYAHFYTTSFLPSSGPVGTSVTVTGSDLTGVTDVRFSGSGGPLSASFTLTSSTSLVASVPSGAVSGIITIVKPGVEASTGASFTVTGAVPTLSFSPVGVSQGGTVTVSGSDLDPAASSVAVDFVATPNPAAASAGVLAGPSAISSGVFTGSYAVSASQAPGSYYVRAIAGSTSAVSSGTLTVASSAAPAISSFTPATGTTGTTVTVTGTNFTGATAVTFNGTSASFTVSSATQITAYVPGGTSSGLISVTSAAGTATSGSSFTVDTTAPSFVYHFPTGGATAVSTITPSVGFGFSELMDTPATQAAFCLMPSGGGACLSGTFSWATPGSGYHELRFAPNSALATGTYTASIAASARDAAGNALSNPYSFEFGAVASGADTTQPSATSSSPAFGATGVGYATTITVTFTDAMGTSPTIRAFCLYPSVSSCASRVDGTASVSGNVFTFDPTADLTPSTSYTLEMRTIARDVSGNALSVPFSGSFVTGTSALSVTPASGTKVLLTATPTPLPAATPTATPVPTATSVPTATPSVAATPVPTPTATPTSVPNTAPTSTSVPPASATPTLVPTGTPASVPTSSASPTPTQTPGVTSTPISTPTPSGTPAVTTGGSAIDPLARDLGLAVGSGSDDAGSVIQGRGRAPGRLLVLQPG